MATRIWPLILLVFIGGAVHLSAAVAPAPGVLLNGSALSALGDWEVSLDSGTPGAYEPRWPRKVMVHGDVVVGGAYADQTCFWSAVNATSSDVLWTLQWPLSSYEAVRGVLLLGAQGNLTGIRISDGRPIWSIAVAGLDASSTIYNGESLSVVTVFEVGVGNVMWSINRSNGSKTMLWSWPESGSASPKPWLGTTVLPGAILRPF